MPRNAKCELCPLHETAETICVWGEGPKRPIVVVVGEAPGAEEDREGRPFVGASGKGLRKELAANDLTDDTYITNVVRCRPPNNRKPTAKEIKACRPYLLEELERLKPKFVVSLGATPTKVLFPGKSKVTQYHGTIVEDDKKTYRGFISYHPAAFLYDPSKKIDFQNDFVRLARAVSGETRAPDSPWSIVRRGNLDQFLDEFTEANEFAFDLETSGYFMHAPSGYVNAVSISLPIRTWVIPLMNYDPINKRKKYTPWRRGNAFQKLIEILVDIQTDTDKDGCAGHNGKFDNNWLERQTGTKFRLTFDTMLASHVLDENREHDLKSLARSILDIPEYDLTKLEKMGFVEPRKLYRYSAFDAYYTRLLREYFWEELDSQPDLKKLYFKLVMPVARAMEDIEMVGKTIDLPAMEETALRVCSELVTIEKNLNKLAGHKVNWNSPKQIVKVLFEDLGLESTLKTDTGQPSTSEEALFDLKGEHPIADELVRFRERDKFLSTYIHGFQELMVGNTLYVPYKIHGTVGGRFSSRFHSIPRDGSIRNLVIAPPGWQFWAADIQQAELRFAAHLSGDLEMRRCFKNDIDLHWRTLMYMLEAGYISSNEITETAIRSAELYTVRQELPTIGASTELLSVVRSCTASGDQSETLLRLAREEGIDSATRRWKRWRADGQLKSVLERGDLSAETSEMDQKVLRTLQEYEELRRASQERKSLRQPKIKLSDAVSLLSSLTPQQAQAIDKKWKEYRTNAKCIGFGFVYGMYENKFIELAKTDYGFEPSWDEAHSMRQGYFQLYTGLLPWHDKEKALCRVNGFARTLSGRLRRLPAINSRDKFLRGEAERQAVNIRVQSFIGDYKSMALVEIHDTIDPKDAKIVGEHHDSVLGIVRDGAEAAVLPVVRRIMKSPKLLETFRIKLDIPMESEIQVGPYGKGTVYVDPDNRS